MGTWQFTSFSLDHFTSSLFFYTHMSAPFAPLLSLSFPLPPLLSTPPPLYFALVKKLLLQEGIITILLDTYLKFDLDVETNNTTGFLRRAGQASQAGSKWLKRVWKGDSLAIFMVGRRSGTGVRKGQCLFWILCQTKGKKSWWSSNVSASKHLQMHLISVLQPIPWYLADDWNAPC